MTVSQGDRPVTLWRRVMAIVRGYRGERLALRAGNLTFITITAIVPMAAVALSLVHVFDHGRIDTLIMKFFDDVLSPGGRAQSESTIRKFLLASKSRTAGGVSFFFLLVSSGVLLRHLDASLNDLWAVRRQRPLLWSLLLYAGVLFVGPLLMALGLIGSDGARRALLWFDLPFTEVPLALGSLLAAVSVFSVLYKLAPHAPVQWASALKGGLAAGVSWEVARRVYTTIASLFFSANPLYGSLGVAPLFLMWIYVGWFIVLAGARLAYALEHADFHHGFGPLYAHPRSAELIGSRIAAMVSAAHLKKRPGPTARELAAALNLPAQRIIDVVAMLEAAGLLIQTRGHLHPAAEPSMLSLADISKAVGGLPRENAIPQNFEAAAEVFVELDHVNQAKLSEISWTSLVQAQGATHEEP